MRAKLMALVLLGMVGVATAAPMQRVVVSDDYTSWLLKGEGNERYGEGEALPRLLAEGWTIVSVSSSCGQNNTSSGLNARYHTIYVLNSPAERTAASPRK